MKMIITWENGDSVIVEGPNIDMGENIKVLGRTFDATFFINNTLFNLNHARSVEFKED